MSVNLQPYKGSRDFYPEAKRRQDYILSVWRQVAEAHSYQSYDSSVIEPLSLYQLKNQTNQEILNDQIYNFTDRGGRQVVLRPEMTPSVSRLVAARRQELSYPLRWYSIPNLWRYERPQRGRLREHWQLNLDLFGLAGAEADFELILIADQILKTFGAPAASYQLKLNHRQLTQSLLTDELGLSEAALGPVIGLIDAQAKLSAEDFGQRLDQLKTGLAAKSLLNLLEIKDLKALPKASNKVAVSQLSQVFNLAKIAGIRLELDLTIVRGFDYYTGIVFEAFDTHADNNRSILGGGRYDELVGSFGVEPLPTVGLGMGDVTTANFLTTHQLWPKLEPANQIYVAVLAGHYQPALKSMLELYQSGLKPIVNPQVTNLSKLIPKLAKQARWLVVIGPTELESGRFKLKDLANSEETELTLSELVARIKAHDSR